MAAWHSQTSRQVEGIWKKFWEGAPVPGHFGGFSLQKWSGWWFGCHLDYFPRNIGLLIIPIDFHIFQRGSNHQPVMLGSLLYFNSCYWNHGSVRFSVLNGGFTQFRLFRGIIAKRVSFFMWELNTHLLRDGYSQNRRYLQPMGFNTKFSWTCWMGCPTIFIGNSHVRLPCGKHTGKASKPNHPHLRMVILGLVYYWVYHTFIDLTVTGGFLSHGGTHGYP